MSESGEVALSFTPEQLASWTEAKERANRCALALAIAVHAVEAGTSDAVRLRAVPAARAAIDDVETSRRACLDLLEGLLAKHGKDPGSLDAKRRELEAAITTERDKLAALERTLIETAGPTSRT